MKFQNKISLFLMVMMLLSVGGALAEDHYWSFDTYTNNGAKKVYADTLGSINLEEEDGSDSSFMSEGCKFGNCISTLSTFGHNHQIFFLGNITFDENEDFTLTYWVDVVSGSTLCNDLELNILFTGNYNLVARPCKADITSAEATHTLGSSGRINDWQLVTLTYESATDTFRFYINESLISSKVLPVFIDSVNGSKSKIQTYETYQFAIEKRVAIDELMVLDSYMTPEQVQEYFESGKSALGYFNTLYEEPVIDYQCSDGFDNDNDGYTDYPNDPSCSSATDTTESPKDGSTCNFEVCSESTFCIASTDFTCVDPIYFHGWDIVPEDIEGFVTVYNYENDNVADLGELMGDDYIGDSGLVRISQIQYDYPFTSNSKDYPLIVHDIDFYFDRIKHSGVNPDFVFYLTNTNSTMLTVRLTPSSLANGDVAVGVYTQGQYLGSSTITSNDGYFFPVKIIFDTETQKFSVMWNDMGDGERSVDIDSASDYAYADNLRIVIGDETSESTIYYQEEFNTDTSDCSLYSTLWFKDVLTSVNHYHSCSVSGGKMNLGLTNQYANFNLSPAMPNSIVEGQNYTISMGVTVHNMISDSTYKNALRLIGFDPINSNALTTTLAFEKVAGSTFISLIESGSSTNTYSENSEDIEYDFDIFFNATDKKNYVYVNGDFWYSTLAPDTTRDMISISIGNLFPKPSTPQDSANVSVSYIQVKTGYHVTGTTTTHDPETKFYLSKVNVYGSNPELESYCDEWKDPYLLKESFNGYLSECDWVAIPDSYSNGNLRFFKEDASMSATKLTTKKDIQEAPYITMTFDTKPWTIGSQSYYSASLYDSNYHNFVRLVVAEGNKLFYVSDGNSYEVASLDLNSVNKIKVHVDFKNSDYDIYVGSVKVHENALFFNTDWVIKDVFGVKFYSVYSDAVIDNLLIYVSDSADRMVEGGQTDAVESDKEGYSMCGLFVETTPKCTSDSQCETGSCNANGKCSSFDMTYCDENGYTRGNKCLMAGMSSCFLNSTKDVILDNFVLFLVFVVLLIIMGYAVYIFKGRG